MKKRFVLAGGLCALALVAAGCGDDDNDALSYEDTGTEIGAICDTVQFDGLNGKPENDAPILEEEVPKFEDAVQEVRDLEVNEELEEIRDQFTDNADQQVEIIKEAQAAAEAGDAKEYRSVIQSAEPLDKESDELASQLGATGCIED
jgi:hypothetical protein